MMSAVYVRGRETSAIMQWTLLEAARLASEWASERLSRNMMIEQPDGSE